MSVDPSICQPAQQVASMASPAVKPPAASPEDKELRRTFDSFLGEVFFGQMLKAMRKTVGKPAYFDGGQTEEIFTQQLDQVLAQKLAETTAPNFSGPMFELFSMSRK
jgi:peptidoglycan hydrolase FlgJ